MKIISLQSGSNGNCIYVEAGGNRLLFDAGISGVQVQNRLAACGQDVRQVDALVVSHDHSDHSRYAGVYQRKFGIPLFATEPTYQAAHRQHGLGVMQTVHHFHAGQSLQFEGCTVETISTPHDSADGVAFIVDDGHHRLGIFTDLGHVFTALAPAIASLDAVLLESNYDPVMLTQGSYPEYLQRRIRGPGGHLSNSESAKLLASAAQSRLRWACLSHLSGENNRPALALDVHRQVLGPHFVLHVASRHQPSDIFEL